MRKFYLYVVLFQGLTSHLAVCKNTSTMTKIDLPYCLHFTWLGPLYDSMSTVNISCDDYGDTPCIEPFIITTDGSEPNITYMWDNYNRSVIGCPLRSGFTCIKYTYMFDNAVVNASYFCGRMIEDSTSALTSGCFSETSNGYTTTACACQTNSGEAPCNESTRNIASLLTQYILILLLLFDLGNILKR